MGVVVEMKCPRSFWAQWWHKMTDCPTFWGSFFRKGRRCPGCNKRIRCYWDGNDVAGHGIDFCNRCAEELETQGVKESA